MFSSKKQCLDEMRSCEQNFVCWPSGPQDSKQTNITGRCTAIKVRMSQLSTKETHLSAFLSNEALSALVLYIICSLSIHMDSAGFAEEGTHVVDQGAAVAKWLLFPVRGASSSKCLQLCCLSHWFEERHRLPQNAAGFADCFGSIFVVNLYYITRLTNGWHCLVCMQQLMTGERPIAFTFATCCE